jgi:mannose-6-phosphate isomerase-like protein (cupin superfamily)
MAEWIEAPLRIQAPGTPPKFIEEFVGRSHTGEERLSLARMVSPAGWSEPHQVCQFDEYALVLRGALQVETDLTVLTVKAGQAVLVRAGERVRYSTPGEEGAEYVAVCLPAFDLALVQRQDS